MFVPLQGLADYALAAAGGKVEAHSRLAYVHPEVWGLWRRTSAVLLPAAGGLVHPEADKVRLRPSSRPCLPSAPLMRTMHPPPWPAVPVGRLVPASLALKPVPCWLQAPTCNGKHGCSQ